MPRWDGQTAQDNLLPLSQEQDDFLVAVAEWEWTGTFEVDCPDFEATCQLCENKGLVYHYEISNRETQNTLWIGSSCIMRFDIAVYGDEGELLTGWAKKRRLDDKVREFKLNQALEPLRALWKVDEPHREIIKLFAEAFRQQNGRIQPKDLLFLFRQMHKYGIAFDRTLYKVRLRSDWEKQQLVEMPDTDLKMIWACLSEKQQEIYQQEIEQAEAEERARQEAQERARQRAAEQIARQQQPEERVRQALPSGPVYELRLPVNFKEQAHRFTVVFRAEDGRLIREPLYRGSEEFCKSYVDSEILACPSGTVAQVLNTRTGEVIYEVSRADRPK